MKLQRLTPLSGDSFEQQDYRGIAPSSIWKKRLGVGASLEWRVLYANPTKGAIVLYCIMDPNLTWTGCLKSFNDNFEQMFQKDGKQYCFDYSYLRKNATTKAVALNKS